MEETVQRIRLNLGAGDMPLEGYTNLDRKTGQEVYPLADVGDGTVDEIRASHVLEHFSHQEAASVLRHWVDKLAPGGVLKIAVPDFQQLAALYLRGEPVNIQGFVMGGHADADDRHGTIFDEETLREAMVACGLVNVDRWTDDSGDCSGMPISLNLRGTKPHAGMPDLRGTRAVLASARFGPALHHRCTHESFGRLGIPFTVMCGCFWHQIICEMMEAAIADPDCTHVLTCDYDSIFRVADVLELHRLSEAYPDADAIVPVQSKRASTEALFTMEDGSGRKRGSVPVSDFQRNLTEIATGHFGLTLIRASALREMARPWMEPKPDPETGRWSGGNVEADISFWQKWRAEGRKVFLANRVRIGHMQELITWPGKDLAPIYQPIQEYQSKGIPAEAYDHAH